MRAGRIPPEAELRIDAVTDGAFVRASDLELYRSLRDEAALAYQGRFASSPPPIATALLVGVQIRVWWLGKLPGVTAPLVSLGTKWSPFVFEDGEVWRLVTMGLLHTDAMHIFMNMVWLAYVGWILERALGWANLVVLYFASVVGGSLLSVFLATHTPSLGASGGVFGLIAAVVVFGFVRPEILPAGGRRWFGPAMLPYLVVMFWSGWSNPSTDNASHLGGLLTGALLGLLVDPDEMERWRGWSRRVRRATLVVCASVLFVLAAVGPRIEPLQDNEAARIAALPPDDPRRHAARTQRPPARPEPKSVSWSVPSGWRPASTTGRFPVFVGPRDDGQARAFGVRVTDRDRVLPVEDAARIWIEALRADWPSAEIEPARPATVAGRDGQIVVARYGHPGDERIATWSGAARGVWLFESIWQRDARRDARLEPLHARLEAHVDWPEPAELIAARNEVAATPRSVRARAALARALARAGEADEALAIHRELVSEHPEDPETRTAQIEAIATLGSLAGDPASLLDDALAATPTPKVIAAVADALDAVGRSEDARGLLVIAWDQAPGDSVLKRALVRRSLPTALDPATSQPWGTIYGPTGAPRSPEALAARRAWPLSLAGAASAAAAASEDRRIATAAAVARIEARDAVRIEPLLVLRDGWVLQDPDEARSILSDELRRAAEGTAPDWMPDEVRAAVAAAPDYAEALSEPGGIAP